MANRFSIACNGAEIPWRSRKDPLTRALMGNNATVEEAADVFAAELAKRDKAIDELIRMCGRLTPDRKSVV